MGSTKFHIAGVSDIFIPDGLTLPGIVITGSLIQINVPGLTGPDIVDWEFGLQSGTLVLTEG
jgi:hypothetical protein